VRDRLFWQGVAFWESVLRTWAVTAVRPVETVQFRPEGGSGEPEMVRPPAPWPRDDIEAAVLEVPGPVPWDRPWLIVDADGEGLLRVDGKPRWGYNEYHREAPLSLAAGATPELRVELVRTGLMGRRFRSPMIRRVAWEDRDAVVGEAAYDLALLREWATDPGTPPEVTSQLAEWIDDALAPIQDLPPDDVAWRAWLRERGGSADTDVLYRRLVERGEAVLGLRALDIRERLARGRATAERLRQVFDRMAERWPKSVGRLLVVGHAHIDLAWLWPMAETRRKIVRTVASQVALLERYPDWVFGMSSPEMWQVLAEQEPDLAARWEALARQGRVEPLGAFWVESDSQLIGAGAVLRHLVRTIRFFQERTGRRVTTAFLPDTFGFASGLPTLLAAAGVRLFVTHKLHWNDTTRFPYRDFWWMGPDGSRVQAQLFGASSHGYNGQATVAELRQAWAGYAAGDGRNTVLYTVGHGDGGGGPSIEHLERVRRLRQLPLVPEVRTGQVEELQGQADPTWPVVRGPLYLEFHRGVFTSQTAVKRGNVRLEHALAALEAWAAWRGVRPLDLEDAWRRVLRNQFHDILPGSSIAAVYEEWRRDVAPLNDAVDAAWATLVQAVEGPSATSLVVAQPAGVSAPSRLITVAAPGPFAVDTGNGWQSAARTYDGRWVVRVPAQPALSWASYPVRWATTAASESGAEDAAGRVTLKTPRGTLVLGPEGLVGWEQDGRELLAEPAGVRGYWNHPAQFDAWELAPHYRSHPVEWSHAMPVVVERNQWRTVVRLQHDAGESRVVEHWAIDDEGLVTVVVAPRIRDRRLVVRWEVPTRLVAPHVEAEVLWGVDRVATWPSTPAEAAKFEWVAHRFVSLAEPPRGVALLNDGRFGHNVEGGRIGITVATAPLYPDPDADADPVPVTLMLVPHGGRWQDAGVLERAHALAAPGWAAFSTAAGPSVEAPFGGLAPNVRVLGLWPAHDTSRDWILTLGECWGDETTATVTFSEAVTDCVACDLIAETPLPVSPAAFDAERRTATVSFSPWAIRTLRIRRSGS
jgi:alpha-mannosidase